MGDHPSTETPEVFYEGYEAHLLPRVGKKRYRIDSQNIEITRGVMNRKTTRIDLKLVYKIHFKQGPLQHCLGWGTIIFLSTDSTAKELSVTIPGARKIFNQLTKAFHHSLYNAKDPIVYYDGPAKQFCNCVDSYLITDQYATLRTVFLSVRIENIDMTHVYDISVERSLLDRCLGRGTLIVYIANQEKWKKAAGGSGDNNPSAALHKFTKEELARFREVAYFHVKDPEEIYRALLPSVNQFKAMQASYMTAHNNAFTDANKEH